MVWILYFLLLISGLIGLVLVILTMPGLWLISTMAAVYALFTHHLGLKALAALVVLSLIAEVLELTLMGREARRAGGRRGTGVGACVGGVFGSVLGSLIPIPIVGTIFGLCLGCFIGAAAVEWLGGSRTRKSIEVGIGAAKGRAYGVASKLIIGCAMILLIMIEGWP